MGVLTALTAGLLLAAAPPARIVSTAPSVTEMLYALGLGDRVVGVTTYCRYPPEAARKPKIGSYTKPGVETILSLRPDLVVVQQTPLRIADQLRTLKLPVLELEHETVAGIYESVRRIGEAAGVPDRARELNTRLAAGLEEVRNHAAGARPRRMMFIVGRTPGTLDGLVAVGRASYLSELIRIAGGVNIFAEAAAAYPKVTHEEVLARDPEVIVDMGDMADTLHVTGAHKRGVVALWNRYPSIAAVRGKRVYAVASDVFVVPGPRLVEAAREFSKMLHPERWR